MGTVIAIFDLCSRHGGSCCGLVRSISSVKIGLLVTPDMKNKYSLLDNGEDRDMFWHPTSFFERSCTDAKALLISSTVKRC